MQGGNERGDYVQGRMKFGWMGGGGGTSGRADCVFTSILYRRVKAPNPTLSQGDGYPGEIWPEGAQGGGRML